MPHPDLQTTHLRQWALRIRNADNSPDDARDAMNELVCAAGDRLESLARKMLSGYPGVRRFEQTGDLLQKSLIRLMHALREVEPLSVRDFFGLAAEQMRRELLDLARSYFGPNGDGTRQSGGLHGHGAAGGLDPPDLRKDPADLQRWGDIREAVAELPAEERVVVEALFYHGWTKPEAAAFLRLDVRTVRRRWTSALFHLHGP